MRCPSAYVWHLVLAATASSLGSTGSICDTDAHGNGAQSLWALMKFIVSIFIVDYPEYKTLLFLAVTMHVCDPHITFQTLDFFFPVFQRRDSYFQGNWIHYKKKLYLKFSAPLTWPEDIFSLEPTCFLWAFPNQQQCSLDSTKKGMPTPGCHGQNEEWEDGGFQPGRTALPSPSCTTHKLILKLSQVITGR